MVIWSKPQVQPPDLTRFSHIEIKYAWSWSFRNFLTSKVCWHFIEFRVGFLGSRSNVIFLQDSRRVLKYQKIYQKYLTSEIFIKSIHCKIQVFWVIFKFKMRKSQFFPTFRNCDFSIIRNLNLKRSSQFRN